MEETNRPYASPGNIRDVLKRYRQVNLPAVVTATDLAIAGVPENVSHRVAFALRFLGMVNENNEPTPEWRSLCAATEEDYSLQLSAMVKKAYAEVFERVNPETDSQDVIRQAFQPYTPKSQIGRMVTFFLTMCNEAGMVTLDAPKKRPTKRQSQNTRSSSSPPRAENKPSGNNGTPAPTPPATPTPTSLQPDYSVIAAIMGRLPANHRWTASQRERWLAAVGAAVDLVVEVEEPVTA
ncbi:MAG: DUF5343 domain-containing protein [Dehalococcoidia bacterium]|nr:DUF5343 domain-containing protein [Dehalococcoidia bacterium]MCA9846176.1 DUF5343 domain-containing protein [Dehalococcoidia bacterium]